MRNKTLTANVNMIAHGTIRGGSFITCQLHRLATLSALHFSSLIP